MYKFYVGNQGNFDRMVICCLKELKEQYNINYAVVLAYLPHNKQSGNDNFTNTILPDGIETVPIRFAISYRNKWMIEQSDYVIAYVKFSLGGAAQFMNIAEKKKKVVINIAQT